MNDPEIRAQELFLLGQIHGLVSALKEGQDRQSRRMDAVDARFDSLDSRLRAVEQRAAAFGAASGGAMAIATALLAESIKQWFRSNASGS
ncbi:hypothetical protein SAMN05443579_10415 [Variovorax sp. PDC80]|uniref:hypothetical protein n=1 Tax=Variovorax sp. PDC80 TaxID=1882827 RepID=UPI0008E3226A|nr:hypothetical protein [Variovorax sp. PDC80]SFO58845.1 hypothetical protein SAMN05443579_10415 [Variovorax sp. PDC80]